MTKPPDLRERLDALRDAHRIVQETVADYCNETKPENVTHMAPIVLMTRICAELQRQLAAKQAAGGEGQ